MIAFWFGIAVSAALPTVLAARFLPETLLASLVDGARWGGPLWFGVVAGLIGLLRNRVHEILISAVEGDHWRELDKKHRGAEFLQKRLDKLLGLSLILGLTSFFVPYGYAVTDGLVSMLIAATPFGSAGYVLWLFCLWTRWRSAVDELGRELAVERRKREQANEQLERLSRNDPPFDRAPPTVKIARPQGQPNSKH